MADKKTLFALGTVAALGAIALARRNPAPPGKITVHFLSNPAGAAVTLDGVLIGNAPFELNVPLGEHLAVFKMEGYVDAIVGFGLEAGQPAFTLTANMTPVTPPPPDAVIVNFISNPVGATVVLDGTPLGLAPLNIEVVFGQHTVVFTLNGYQDMSFSLTLTAETPPMTLTANLSPVPPPTAHLTLNLQGAVKFWGFTWFPRVTGTIVNNSDQTVNNREIRLYRRYVSPQSGLVHVDSTTDILRIYGVPQSGPLSPVTLPPGGVFNFDFIGAIDCPGDVSNDIWIQDGVTEDKSIILAI